MRELFTDSIRAGLANIDLHDLKEPAPDAKAPELIFKDSVKWTVLPDRLRIECTREFEFEPECNFSLTITYFVEHFLKVEGSLDKYTGEEIKKAIVEDLAFSLQSNQDFSARMSLLAAQIFSNFGGSPAITPPAFPIEQDKMIVNNN